MNTGIDLNSAIAQAAVTAAMVDQAAAGQKSEAEAKLAPLLGGASLTITSVGNGDLQALLDKLKNEQERTKMSLLISSLKAISQSLTDAQKAALDKGVELSNQLDALDKELSDAQGKLKLANADVALMQTRIDALEAQIEQARQDGKDHLKLDAELKKLREEKAAEEQVVAETTGKINELSNKVSSVKAQLYTAISAVGENALKTIAAELAGLMEPEKAETAAETDKRQAKEDELNPFRAIRDSLEKFSRELTDAIESNITQMV